MTNNALGTTGTQQTGGGLGERIDLTIRKLAGSGRGFFIVVLQIDNLAQFRKRRPAHVVNGLLRELHQAVRGAVHQSQFVGYFQDGLGLVFDGVDVGQVDTVSRRLVQLAQHVIRAGRYNDLTSRWTDILQQFLWPNNPGILMPRVGWAIAPRDGQTSTDLIKRAKAHIAELAK